MTPLFPSQLAIAAVLLGNLSSAQEVIPDAEPIADSKPLSANPEQDLFQIAEMMYQQAQNPAVKSNPDEFQRTLLLAAERYSEFTSKFPKSEQTPLALYRMGSCLMDAGKTAEAFQIYGVILQQYKGDIAAAAAYRLATEANKVSDLGNAERFFLNAIKESSNPQLKIDAQYRLGRVYVARKNNVAAKAQFQAIRSNPQAPAAFAHAARQALASCFSLEGNNEEAYALYKELLAMPGLDAKTRGDALLQAGALAALLKKDGESTAYYEEIVKNPSLGNRSGEAKQGLMMSMLRAGDYDKIIAMYNVEPEFADKVQEAGRKMIAAQAFEKKGDSEQARNLYLLAERFNPKTMMAMEAAFRRLQSHYQDKLPGFAERAKAFLSVYARLFPNHIWNETVRLMAAESLFATNPGEASAYYAAIDLGKLPKEMQADILYKSAWAMGAAGNRNAAVVLLTQFITTYPSDSRTPEALVKRGEMNLNMGKEAESLVDFNQVISKWPKNQAASLAWQKLGQFYARKQDIPNMIKYYEGLINNFPKVMPAALSEAQFMVGRGYFDKKAYDKSIPHLEEARTLNPEKYRESVSQLLILTYYQLQDAKHLKEAMEYLREKNPESMKGVPEMIPAWLGMQASASGDFETADRYLSIATSREGLKNSKRIIWKTLAKARLALKRYDMALSAVNMYLKEETQPYRKAEGLLCKAQIFSGMGKYSDAKAAAEEGLALGVEGPLLASLKIVLGDVAYALKEYDEAAKHYGTTAELFVSDKELKPQAIYKAKAALEKMNRTTEAAHFQTILDKEFPGWKPKEDQMLPGQSVK